MCMTWSGMTASHLSICRSRCSRRMCGMRSSAETRRSWRSRMTPGHRRMRRWKRSRRSGRSRERIVSSPASPALSRIPGIWPTQRNRFTFFWQFFWLSLSSVLRWTHSSHRSSFFCRSECASSTISDRMCFSGRFPTSRRLWQRSCS